MEERDDLSRDILKVSGVVLSFFLCFLCVGFFGFFMSLSFSASFSLFLGSFISFLCISLGDRDFVPPAVWSPNGSIETTALPDLIL